MPTFFLSITSPCSFLHRIYHYLYSHVYLLAYVLSLPPSPECRRNESWELATEWILMLPIQLILTECLPDPRHSVKIKKMKSEWMNEHLVDPVERCIKSCTQIWRHLLIVPFPQTILTSNGVYVEHWCRNLSTHWTES